MPELPDLTVFAENLSRQVTGEKVAEANWHHRGRLNAKADELSSSLAGSSISRVERSGKEICFSMDNGNLLFVHLMLNGRFVLTPTRGTIPSFAVLTVSFENGKVMTVQDSKGLATVSLNPRREDVPDALEVDGDLLKQLIAAKPKMLAKAFLIDQKILRGIGNAYADEILWKAGISPRSVVGKLPDGVVGALATAVHTVLDDATRQIRTNHPGIIAGEIRDFLAVHNSSRAVSPDGHPIRVENISSKKTYFTDGQVLYA